MPANDLSNIASKRYFILSHIDHRCSRSIREYEYCIYAVQFDEMKACCRGLILVDLCEALFLIKKFKYIFMKDNESSGKIDSIKENIIHFVFKVGEILLF